MHNLVIMQSTVMLYGSAMCVTQCKVHVMFLFTVSLHISRMLCLSGGSDCMVFLCVLIRGLILQDLTFINIGNKDCLPDGRVNFNKRWQQFNVLDSMRRFKTTYVLSSSTLSLM